MKNSKRFVTALLLTGLAVSAVSCNSGSNNASEVSNGPKTDTVIISGMKFNPELLSVPQGDTVFWINKDIVTHNVTEDTAKTWTSGEIVVGASWKMVPENDFNYLCSIHPTMKGSVHIVK